MKDKFENEICISGSNYTLLKTYFSIVRSGTQMFVKITPFRLKPDIRSDDIYLI